MDLDLRKLRYFAAVAEHKHFGRAAAQLFIAQPVLSRQVRALERELGCTLLLRSTRSVELTAAGEQLRIEASAVFAEIEAALRRVHAKGRDARRLVVGFAPGLHVADAVRAFTVTHPEVVVDLLQLDWWEQDAPLRDGRVHLGFMRRPFDEHGLRVLTVGQEAKVAWMPADHRCARQASLSMADLEGEVLLDAHARRTSSVAEKLELIAAGRGVALVPRSVAQAASRPDVVHRTVIDAAPVDTCLVITHDAQPLADELLAEATRALVTPSLLT